MRKQVILAIWLLVAASHVHAQNWTKLGADTLKHRYNRSCYFLNQRIGFTYVSGLATGDSIPIDGPAYLYRTTDSGQTWTYIPMFDTVNSYGSKFPRAGTAIYQLYFISPAHGYLAGSRGLFETHDTGSHWQKLVSRFCLGVHATDSTIYTIVSDSIWHYPTSWYSPGMLMYSHDDGVSWDTLKRVNGLNLTSFWYWQGDAQHFGMIDLVGNRDGFVAAIYSDSVPPYYSYLTHTGKQYRMVFTTDDGTTWQEQPINTNTHFEASSSTDPIWGFEIQSLCIPHSTSIFLVSKSDTGEEDEYTYQRWNLGDSTREVYHWESGLFPASAGCVIYTVNANAAVQKGMLRSTDEGATWALVEGRNGDEIDDNDYPALAITGYGSTIHSSAGAVTSVHTELWRSTTGGDGTLSPSALAPKLRFETYTSSGPGNTVAATCDSGTVTIIYDNIRCAYTKFNSLSVIGLNDRQYSYVPTRHLNSLGTPDTAILRLTGLPVGTHDYVVRMRFIDDEFAITDTDIHFTAVVSSGGVRAALFSKSSLLTGVPGDTILVPLYMGSLFATDSLLIQGPSAATLQYTLNTNVLTPVDFKSVLPGVTTAAFAASMGHADLTLNFQDTLRLGFQTLVGYLRCRAAVADSSVTQITAAGTQFHSSDTRCIILSTREAGAIVQINPFCGVQSISQFMSVGELPDIFQIRPNPASAQTTVYFRNDLHRPIHYEFSDALGITRRTGTVTSNELLLDLQYLPAGVYYLRATGARGGITATRKIVVTK